MMNCKRYGSRRPTNCHNPFAARPHPEKWNSPVTSWNRPGKIHRYHRRSGSHRCSKASLRRHWPDCNSTTSRRSRVRSGLYLPLARRQKQYIAKVQGLKRDVSYSSLVERTRARNLMWQNNSMSTKIPNSNF